MTRRIEGYAAIFNVPDTVNDTIMPGAFRRALRKGKPELHLDHFRGIAGEVIEAREDEKGLFIVAELHRDVGDMDGMSIGFRERKARRGTNWRELVEVELIEVSVCREPLHPLARFWDAGEKEAVSPEDRAYRGEGGRVMLELNWKTCTAHDPPFPQQTARADRTLTWNLNFI